MALIEALNSVEKRAAIETVVSQISMRNWIRFESAQRYHAAMPNVRSINRIFPTTSSLPTQRI